MKLSVAKILFMDDEMRTQVLVVGAGLSGLSSAMFLAQQGIEVLVVERHPGTSVHPRATGQTPRTMELLRIGGVAEEVLRGNAGVEDGHVIKVAESLRGQVLHTIIHETDDMDTSAASPAPWGLATQDVVEPVLLHRAEELGARALFGTEVVSVDQDDEGVTAHLLDRPTGRLTLVRADYLIAADGHRGKIRERFGVARHGRGSLAHHIGVIFEADLDGYVVPRRSTLYYLQNPAFTGVLGVTVRHNIFTVEYHPERGESPADFTEERCTELIRVAADTADLAVKIRGIQAWEMAAWVNEKFRDDRVFFVGDAAKVTPPTGGLGGNTAVQDGFDIAWKLAAVLHGEAGEGLLDSYEAERKPYAEMVVAGSLHNYVERMAPHLRDETIPGPVDPMGLILGYRCRSAAVLVDDDDECPLENPFHPSGRPGFRAPHVPVTHEGREMSAVDLFGGGWVLITRNPAWVTPKDFGVELRVPRIDDPTGQLGSRYGIGVSGASLVRLDGVVAWRCDHEADDPATTLNGVFDAVLARGPSRF
jgi:putative polyketide hydroxylase